MKQSAFGWNRFGPMFAAGALIPTTRTGDAQTSTSETVAETSVHASIHNHFNVERYHVDPQSYRDARSAARAEWEVHSREEKRAMLHDSCGRVFRRGEIVAALQG